MFGITSVMLDCLSGLGGKMRLFTEEVVSLSDWFKQHSKTCTKGCWFVELDQSSKSGIGTNTYAKCICGEQKDITDYESW